MNHVPLSPFDNQTATQNVRLAEDAWSHDPVRALSLKINGRTHSVQAPDEMPLLWVLRDLLNLKGTKFGCGMANAALVPYKSTAAPFGPACCRQRSWALAK
jgi:hypothetical protein